jgi:hypothetical protein
MIKSLLYSALGGLLLLLALFRYDRKVNKRERNRL